LWMPCLHAGCVGEKIWLWNETVVDRSKIMLLLLMGGLNRITNKT
jgi:hypothetical protein